MSAWMRRWRDARVSGRLTLTMSAPSLSDSHAFSSPHVVAMALQVPDLLEPCCSCSRADATVVVLCACALPLVCHKRGRGLERNWLKGCGLRVCDGVGALAVLLSHS